MNMNAITNGRWDVVFRLLTVILTLSIGIMIPFLTRALGQESRIAVLEERTFQIRELIELRFREVNVKLDRLDERLTGYLTEGR